MDSSGRTTQRQYYVGRGRPNTNSAEHLGVSEKWEDRMERKRELLLVSCKIKRRKTRNPHPTPGGRLSLAEREPFGLIHTEPRPCGHTPQRGWQLQGTTVHGQKMQRPKSKRSGHCASSIKEKPIDWDPECRSRKSAWQRHLFLDLCPAGGGNLSPALCPLLDF